jgi:ElaB/YqjD/DUF883 family membrane-anchored ribosome-binding protein
MNQFNRPTSTTSAGSAASDLVSSAQDKVSETVEQAQALAQEQYDKLEAAIRRSPLQAAAVAAGIGFILALLARR